MKILIAGAGGLVGRALTEHCRTQGDEVFAYDHQSLDIADPEKVAPGQRMGVNVPDAKDRADLIAYLKKASPAGK